MNNKNENCKELSISQQGLWFLSKSDSAVNASYNIVFAFTLHGEINIDLFSQTIDILVNRHEMLRTRFSECEDLTPCFTVDNYDKESSSESVIHFMKGSLESVGTQVIGESLDLTNGPLYKVIVVEDKNPIGLVFVFHHIIFDEPSAIIFFSELEEIYLCLQDNLEVKLKPLNNLFSTTVSNEKKYLLSEYGKSAVRKLVSFLKNAQTRLELPRNKQKTKNENVVPPVGLFEIKLNHKLVRAIQELAFKNRVTPSIIYLAAFQLLLWKYSEQKKFLISIPVANRISKNTESLIGYLTNSVLLTANLDSELDVNDFLNNVSNQLLDLLDFSEIPFPLVTRELGYSNEPFQSDLFQITFNYIKQQKSSWYLGSTLITPILIKPLYAKNELTLDIIERTNESCCWFLYDADGFDKKVIKQLTEHYISLLKSIVKKPSNKLSTLSLLTNKERQQILVNWNNTNVDYPDECIHQLFESQVKSTPDAIAIEFEGQRISYSELNIRANQLAYYLRECGVSPDILVAVCLERSTDMVVALLGILKAGGAYLPLDQDYPNDRLAFMLKESNAALILTQTELLECIPEYDAKIECIDELTVTIEQYPKVNPVNYNTSQNLVYCMFTSGSTGKPKAIGVIHSGVVRLVKNTNYVRFSESDVFLLLAPLSFDASTFELWGSLLNGAQLAIIRNTKLTFDDLGNEIEFYGVTTLWLTAALFEQFCQQHVDSLKEVKQLLAGGDILSPKAIRRVLDAHPNNTLINGYGPTESTTFAMYFSFPSNFTNEEAPIGKPISNTQVYILDEYCNPVPVGVVGELYIGGAGLARGYLNQPELTAENFVPNPYGDAGSRLYRTGDLARYLPDGNVEFKGRVDHQIKLRGFRIELAEIETVLCNQENISNAVVILREDNGTEDKQLVAYIVTIDGLELGIEIIRSLLKEKLPEYMIPNAFVYLEVLPLSPSGKINRKALPKPELNRKLLVTEFLEPQTETEKLLAAIWCDVLKIERVGVHDNFFVIGGHSLIAVSFISIVNKKGFNLTLENLFINPTIFELSQLSGINKLHKKHFVKESKGARKKSVTPTLRVEDAFKWSQLQEKEGDRKPWIITIVLEFNYTSSEKIHNTITKLIEIHPILGSRFHVKGSNIFLVSGDVKTSFYVEKNRTDMKSKVLKLINEENSKVCKLEGKSLSRFSYVTSDVSSSLVIFMEHIISDLHSLSVLKNSITNLLSGSQVTNTLFLDYLTYSDTEPTLLKENHRDKVKSYQKLLFLKSIQRDSWWTKKLPQPPYKVGEEKEIKLASSEVNKLTINAQKHGCTFFTCLLGSFVTTIQDNFNFPIFDIETFVDGRTPDTDGILGLFMNSLILRFKNNDDRNNIWSICELANKSFFIGLSNSDLGFSEIRRLADKKITVSDFSWPLLFTYQKSSSKLYTSTINKNNYYKDVTEIYMKESNLNLKNAISVTLRDGDDGVVVKWMFDYRLKLLISSDELILSWRNNIKKLLL